MIRIARYVQPVSGKDAVAGNGTALHCRPLGPTAPHLPVNVRGWAYSASGIERVEVYLDGRSRHEALYGLTRPHIREALGSPDALECGYYVQLEPFSCEPGEHEITVVATPREGPPVGVSRSFVCADDSAALRGEAEPSVPAEPSPRPRSVPLDAPVVPPAEETRRRWISRLAEGRAALDADRDVDELSKPLPFESGSFDVVTCFEGLASVDDPERALAELCRVLRPGGLLIVSWGSSGEPDPSGLALVAPDELSELHEAAAGWKERALRAEAEAAAMLTERAQAQRGEERAFMFLRAAEERRRAAERALERRPIRRLRRLLARMTGGS